MSKKAIYILRDPRTNEVKYVGASNNPHKRLTAHNSSNYQATSAWAQELKAQGLSPKLEIVREHTSHWRREELEEINSHSGLLNGKTTSVPTQGYVVRKALGDSLEEARLRSNMTQTQAATAMGKHQHTIAQWESGRRSPNTTNLYGLAATYNTTPGDLMQDASNVAKEVLNTMKKEGKDGKATKESK